MNDWPKVSPNILTCARKPVSVSLCESTLSSRNELQLDKNAFGYSNSDQSASITHLYSVPYLTSFLSMM